AMPSILSNKGVSIVKVRIELTYKTSKGTEATFNSEEMRAGKALLIAEDFEKTGRSKNIYFIDGHESTWTLKELKKYMEGIQTEAHNVTDYFDGVCDQKSKNEGRV